MSQPNMEAELMEAAAAFWDKESAEMRESVMIACGYDLAQSLDFSKVGFGELNTWAQRAVANLVGEIVGKRLADN